MKFQSQKKGKIEGVGELPQAPQSRQTYEIDVSRLPERMKVIWTQLETSPTSSGRDLLRKHILGIRLTSRQRGVAMCCECMGFYKDGRHDCECPQCALYPQMPYRAGRKKHIQPDRQ